MRSNLLLKLSTPATLVACIALASACSSSSTTDSPASAGGAGGAGGDTGGSGGASAGSGGTTSAGGVSGATSAGGASGATSAGGTGGASGATSAGGAGGDSGGASGASTGGAAGSGGSDMGGAAGSGGASGGSSFSFRAANTVTRANVKPIDFCYRDATTEQWSDKKPVFNGDMSFAYGKVTSYKAIAATAKLEIRFVKAGATDCNTGLATDHAAPDGVTAGSYLTFLLTGSDLDPALPLDVSVFIEPAQDMGKAQLQLFNATTNVAGKQVAFGIATAAKKSGGPDTAFGTAEDRFGGETAAIDPVSGIVGIWKNAAQNGTWLADTASDPNVTLNGGAYDFKANGIYTLIAIGVNENAFAGTEDTNVKNGIILCDNVADTQATGPFSDSCIIAKHQ